MRNWQRALLLNSARGGAPSLTSPSFAVQNTAYTNDMGPDGYNWAQGGARGPIAVDSYGKIFAISENSGGNHALTYSNDSGTTWADALALGFLTRGAIVYNSADDRVEVLWMATAASDGMLYRAYTISRDGSNNITGFTAAGSGYCQLDAETTGTMQYQHPCILWLNDAAYGAHGAIVAVWSARNTGTGGTGNEVRAAMRILSGTVANDQNPANWIHIGVSSTTTIGNAPGAASYTAIVANVTAAIPHAAIVRQANKDIFIGYDDGASTWKYRRATWASGSNNWTALTGAATISAIQRAGTNTGYADKGDLLSKPVEDASGNVYLGIATWKDNTSGDTWGYAQITSADAITLVDTYSSGGAHSYAPTGDIEYDSLTNQIVVSYIKTTTQFAYAQLYSGIAASGSEITIFTSAPVDIPLIRTRVITGKLGVLFRDTNTPHLGWWGALTWV